MSAYPESASETGDDAVDPESAEGGAANAEDLMLILDISDLLVYFAFNRTPTGIQRVQTEIARQLASSRGGQVSLTRLSEATGEWKTVPASMFEELIAAGKAGGDIDDPQWIATRNRIDRTTLGGPATHFSPGATLVNLGSSWWSPNYFLHIRRLKEAFGVAYVPLIYDMIPIVDQESCSTDLTTQFIDWAIGVLDHADYFLAISEASKRDLIVVAQDMGRTLPAELVDVIPLDADYRQGKASGDRRPLPAQVTRSFVLLVSTIEYRKNQLMALDAWRELINRHGGEQIPQLVLVGKIGNQGDLVVDRLALDVELARHVTILSGIDDAQLATLYEAASFTLYPSRYEGWGLPVTESLCFGQAALVARNSSLPEAGGDHVSYFDTSSLRSLVSKLETLLFDAKALDESRRRARTFQARTWLEISEQVRAAVIGWRGIGTVDLARLTPNCQRGAYYPLLQNASTAVWPGINNNETFRSGIGWYTIEHWGCWSKSPGGDLAFRVEEPGEVRLALRVHVPSGFAPQVTISNADPAVQASARAVLARTVVQPGKAKWMTVRTTPVAGHVKLSLRCSEALKEEGSGRILSVGLSGIFVFAAANGSEFELAEAIALGSLIDHDPHRRIFPAPPDRE